MDKKLIHVFLIESESKEALAEVTRNLCLSNGVNFMVFTMDDSALRKMQEMSVKEGREPSIGHVRFGDLRRVKPISSVFGFDRGRPIDRYYIENFLARYAEDVKGHVLEVGTDTYTRKFGGDRVTSSDVLHVWGHPKATIVADLQRADDVPPNTFDCIIFTQTLHVIYDLKAVIRTLHRILKPNGVLLATFPGISQVNRYDMDRWGDYWRLTTLSTCRLFEEVFEPEKVTVEAHGNVLTSIAFLHGLAVEELTQDELNYHDPDYEMLITVRAVK